MASNINPEDGLTDEQMAILEAAESGLTDEQMAILEGADAGLTDEQMEALEKKSAPYPSIAEQMAASLPVRALTGAASIPLGAMEYLPGKAGEYMRESNKTLKDMVKRGESIQQLPHQILANISGFGGEALPYFALPWLKGGKGFAPKLKQYSGNVGMGAATGAVGAATAPGAGGSGGLEQLIERAGPGAMLGGGLTALMPVATYAGGAIGGKAMDFFRGLSKSGRSKIGHKVAVDQLTPDEQAKVLQMLPYSPRNAPTSPLGLPMSVTDIALAKNVGQTAKSSEVSRLVELERKLGREVGAESIQKSRDAADAAIRESADVLSAGRPSTRVGQVVHPDSLKSADDVALEAWNKQRKSVADKLYGESGKKFVGGDEALNELLERDAVRRYGNVDIRSASNVPRATSLGEDVPALHDKITNITRPAQFKGHSVEHLQNTYRNMEKEANRLYKTGNPADATLAGEIRQAKNDLGDWLRNKSPDWARANRVYKEMSARTRQMEVGQDLKRKLVSPAGGGITPDAFLSATADKRAQEKMIGSITGRPNLSLEDIYGTGQRSTISALRGEADLLAARRAMEGKKSANMIDEKPLQLPQLIQWQFALANKLLRDASQTGRADVMGAAAAAIQDPVLMRKIIENEMKSAGKREGALSMIGKAARLPSAYFVEPQEY